MFESAWRPRPADANEHRRLIEQRMQELEDSAASARFAVIVSDADKAAYAKLRACEEQGL